MIIRVTISILLSLLSARYLQQRQSSFFCALSMICRLSMYFTFTQSNVITLGLPGAFLPSNRPSATVHKRDYCRLIS